MPEGTSVVVDEKRCQFHYFTGKVLSSAKQKETVISSQSYGTQNNPQVSVSSSTVDHHEFFLADAGGQERAFKMVNFDFPCREGQTLTVMWVIPEGAQEGPYVAVHNHNTGEFHAINPIRIEYLFKKPALVRWGSAIGLGIVIAFASWFLGLIAFVAPLVYFKLRQTKAAKALLASDALRQLDVKVAQLKPLPA